MDQQSGAGLGLIDLNVSKYFHSLSNAISTPIPNICVFIMCVCV